MTDIPPPGEVPGPPGVPNVPGPPDVPAPPQYVPPPPMPTSPADRVRIAWHDRAQSDYIFDFWTALGWTILTCGIYGVYVVYQLVRRSRDHNRRRVEMLDAATTFAWEQAQARGVADELRPNFEEVGRQMATLRVQETQFRDPAIWAILALFFSTIVHVVAYCLLDGDLIKHDYAEGAIENELSTIYGRLGSPVATPDPGRLRTAQNYVGAHRRDDRDVGHLPALVGIRRDDRRQQALPAELGVGGQPRQRGAATPRDDMTVT